MVINLFCFEECKEETQDKWLITVLSAIVLIFIPTTKEAYLIYGVGGTIDYIQNNDTAKQLPDKVIKCADIFFDNYIEESSQEKVLKEKTLKEK